MTESNFKRYIKNNKPVSIKWVETGELKILFKNGKFILIINGYEGFVYTHQREIKKIKDGNVKLIQDLNKLAPTFVKDLKEKYSMPFSDLALIINGKQ